ncbi:ArsR/SmtB family transcription factor [Acrocarpospora catenulata]|uniref:ArsR/SmtB family transcription factor n=1 Tax=Acrocarpospora catenulata TaxID=2836182 RepID=UPI001BD93D76|nr:helix-turn-helix domain-containing protein [Acrocarpospora catenulata]
MDVIRHVDDVETLKALSDPLRLAIMRCLMRDPRAALSVKELAHELDQPPTRLYRHIKVLEKVDLIRVASTRVVSGIIEYQYQAAQLSLRISRELVSEPGNKNELAAAILATLDDFRARLLRDVMAGRLGQERTSEGTDGNGADETPAPLVIALDNVLPPARAVEFRARLDELVQEFNDPEGTEGIPIEFLLMMWSPRNT